MHIDVIGPLASTLDHLARLSSKAATIKAARVAAEEAFCHRLGVAWRAGELTAQEALELYEQFRPFAAAGFSHRYQAAGCPTPQSLRAAVANAPNGTNGTWHGPAVLTAQDPAPVEGTAVVYVLYDAELQPVYVGSTGNLRARLRAHRRDKVFAHWTAQPCMDREHAFAMEAAAIRAHMPTLNTARPQSRPWPRGPVGAGDQPTPQGSPLRSAP